MANFDFLTDEYVAQLLAKDAKESSIRYSAIGLDAYTASKPPANKPKPNTRFLRNIIKDTDNHNAALLAKETAEAHGRLQSLQDAVSERNKNSRKAIRKNQLGEIEAILGGVSSKRKRRRETNSLERPSRKSSENEEQHERKSKSRRREKDQNVKVEPEDKSKAVKKDRRFKGLIDTLREREKQESSKSRHKPLSKYPKKSKSENNNETSVERKNSKSAESRHSNKICHDQNSRSEKRPENRTKGRKTNKNSKKDVEDDSDSDPLDDIIGPSPVVSVPEVRKRGRGNTSDASGIDSRFSAVYNPRADILIEKDDTKSFDQALEAFRDWKKFKEKGIERLRSAGFSEEEIQRLEGGDQKREKHVKWTKPGESREWDRGKEY
ncbi:hypothetical protein EPUL_006323 [Erysiphe pulchra]|uniref:Pre-mRNA-splicing factor 38B n=1 Tax=Erysiphe pulchra TaxID=225359 RepID=A0A2S4PM10_9PEZI|nr:hypothetical protein EPUL_006323 [Erysiphe pulchra]